MGSGVLISQDHSGPGKLSGQGDRPVKGPVLTRLNSVAQQVQLVCMTVGDQASVNAVGLTWRLQDGKKVGLF